MLLDKTCCEFWKLLYTRYIPKIITQLELSLTNSICSNMGRLKLVGQNTLAETFSYIYVTILPEGKLERLCLNVFLVNV